MRPLATIVLPPRRSSLLSTSPHTPRSSRGSPTCQSLFLTTSAANRKSADSWTSSNQDEVEWEWKPEQTLLLSRTLDALPSHLLTPFNGPVPPSNLLDKIARGVSHAKGPEDWPHSLRATRAKLVEISRVRAKDNSKIVTEEDDEAYFGGDVLQQTTNTGPRRPLYRQSSMDFMNNAKPNLKDNDHLNRLSNRLQRTDRLISNPSYHPYSRPSLHRSPSSNSHPDSLPPSLCLSPSTPSSTTLNSSFASVPSRPLNIRRSTSTLSSSSDPYLLPSFPAMAEDPRVQRVRRSDPFCTPYNVNGTKGTKQTLKRAPSFGATGRDMENNGHSSPYPSSDEEEKIRSKKAKKPRTKTTPVRSPAPTSPPSSPLVLSPAPPSQSPSKPKRCVESTSSSSKSGSGSSTSKSSSNKTVSTAATTVTAKSSCSRPKANLQRNPSIFGAELPHPQTPVKTPAQPRSPTRTHPANTSTVPAAHPAHPTKTLRRVRATSFARAPARRISFGSLVAPAEEANLDAERAAGALGSAFQLM